MKYLELIVNSISNGIIAVDRNLKTILVNPFACTILNISSNRQTLGIKIQELINDEGICSLLEKSILEDCSFFEEITIDNDSKILSTSINPIKSDLEIIGAVLFLQDITKMRNIEKMGKEFVSNVSHELKTPLTSIRGFIETLKNGAINDHAVAYKFLDIIDIEAERLFFLINDILALSEIETMKQDANLSSINLEEIISDSVTVLQGQAEKKNISINYDIEPNLKLKVSKHKLMQLVLNLMDNSIKYSPDYSWIKINARKSANSIIISFKDSGIGISKEHQTRIFERFYRVDKGRSRSLGGTGLGLSIVKHIVDIYNGTITLNSEVGKGTEFIVTFPVL
ncbi:MAG: ATP-binding protein [Deltaproteobacteria bacterium]